MERRERPVKHGVMLSCVRTYFPRNLGSDPLGELQPVDWLVMSEQILRAVTEDAFEANELFQRNGWTDGLPIVPPTPDRVARFLDGAGLAAEPIVSAEPVRHRTITAGKLAINAVMAGGLPEAMPLPPDMCRWRPKLLKSQPIRERAACDSATQAFEARWASIIRGWPNMPNCRVDACGMTSRG